MKSEIDLTENRAFNPKNFELKKTESVYYDSKGNRSRLPWDKKGKLFANHSISFWYNSMDTPISITWSNLDMVNSTNVQWYVNDTITSISTTLPYTNLSTSYRISTSTFGDQIYLYGNNDEIGTYSYRQNSDSWSKVVYTNESNHGIRTGKVSDIKHIIMCNEPKIYKIFGSRTPWYNDTESYKYNPHYEYHNLNSKRRYYIGLFGKNRNTELLYNGFRKDYDEDFRVGEFKTFTEPQKLTSDYPLCNILANNNKPIKCIYSIYSHGDRYAVYDGKFRISLLFNNSLDRFSENQDGERKIKWPDFHEDYIREIEGLRPRNDWRRGINGRDLENDPSWVNSMSAV